jgi:hypothetical protein
MQHLRRKAQRVLATPGAFSFSSSRTTALPAASTHPGLLEVRSYALHPNGMQEFVKLANDHGTLRKQLLPLLGLFTVDTGDYGNGASLNTVVHLYAYDNFEQRDTTRRAAAANPTWQAYIAASRPFVARQESAIFLSALGVLDAARAPAIGEQVARDGDFEPRHSKPPSMYEFRQTQLLPGYGSVPKVIEAFARGIPAKVAADTEGQLMFFGYTDVGILNKVIEIWRYPSAQACIKARQAARQVPEWREAIGAITPGVETFRTAFLNPMASSPLQ